MKRALLPLLVFALLPDAADAAEMRSVEVDYSDGHYTMASSIWFDAQVEQVYAVFRRWDLSTQFSSAIEEAYDVEADELTTAVPHPQQRVRPVLLRIGRAQRLRGRADERNPARFRGSRDQRLPDEQRDLDFRRGCRRYRRQLSPVDEAEILGATWYRTVLHKAQAEERWWPGNRQDRGDRAGPGARAGHRH